MSGECRAVIDEEKHDDGKVTMTVKCLGECEEIYPEKGNDGKVKGTPIKGKCTLVNQIGEPLIKGGIPIWRCVCVYERPDGYPADKWNCKFTAGNMQGDPGKCTGNCPTLYKEDGTEVKLVCLHVILPKKNHEKNPVFACFCVPETKVKELKKENRK